MPEPSPSSSHDRERLERILSDYLLAVEAGRTPDHDALLRQHPDLADELASFFRNRDAVRQQAHPLQQDPLPPTIGPGDSAGPALGTTIRYFGDYEVLEEIARGSMGVVFKARQVSLNRVVALKMILAGRLASADEVTRFRREAEAAANLDHPNIVPIYEVGEYEGQHYFSMKRIEGGSLAQNRTPLTPRAAAGLLATVARAVHHAHQRGILHRDLKPANILVDGSGQPWVTDFGLARRAEAAAVLTHSGAIVGTPEYMAPEQALGRRDLTTASDVWSLGAILYSLLVGEPPFQGDNTYETLRRVLEEEPIPPRAGNPRIDRDLETICLECLRKDPAARYGSAEALARDLQRWLAGEPIAARPAGRVERFRRWCRRNPVVAGLTTGIGLLLIAGTIGLLIGLLQLREANSRISLALEKARDSDAEARALLDENRGQLGRRHVAEGARAMQRSDLTDALLYFTEALRQDPDNPVRADVHRRRVALTLRQCPRLCQVWFHKGPVLHAEFSRDGRRVVTASRDGTARVWDAFTGEPVCRPLEHGHPVGWATFTPDGRRVVTLCDREYRGRLGSAPILRGEVRVWDAGTGRPLTPPLDHAWSIALYRMRGSSSPLSAAGDRLVTVARNEAVVRDASTGTALGPPVKHDGTVEHAVWGPGDRTVLTIADTGLMSVAALGQPRPFGVLATLLARGVPGSSEVRVWEPATGRLVMAAPWGGSAWPQTPIEVPFRWNGHGLLVPNGDGSLRLWDVSSGRPHPAWSKSFANGFFSPDGRRMLVLGPDPPAWYDTASGRRISPDLAPVAEKGLIVSPDGRHLVTRPWNIPIFGSGTSVGTWNVERINGKPRILLARTPDSLGTAESSVVCSPDGRLVVTVSPSAARVWDLDTGQPLTPELRHGPDGGVRAGEDRNVPSGVLGAAIAPEGRRVVTVGSDGTARLWDTAPDVILLPVGGDANLTHGRVLRREDRAFQVIETRTGRSLTGVVPVTFRYHQGFFLSRDGRHVFAWSTPTDPPGQSAIVWDADTGRLVGAVSTPTSFRSVAFAPDGRHIVTVTTSGKGEVGDARLWDVAAGRVSAELGRQGLEEIAKPSFSQDGRYVVTCPPEKGARLWDVSGKPARVVDLAHEGSVRGFRFSPDGGRLLTLAGTPGKGDTREVRLWDSATGRQVGDPLRHDGSIRLVRFSRDTRWLLTQGRGETSVRLWDPRAGRPAATQLGPTGEIADAVFSPNGRLLAAVATDGRARVWDLATGQPSTPLLPETASVEFTADSRFLLTDCRHRPEQWDNTTGRPQPWSGTQLWDIDTGQPISPALGGNARLVPGADQILTSNRENWLWDYSPDARPAEDLIRLAQLLSGRRFDASGELVALEQTEFRAIWESLRAAHPSESKPPTAVAVADWHRRQADACFRSKQWFGVLYHSDRLAPKEPRDGAYHARRGECLANLGRWAEAEKHYREAARLRPRLANDWFRLGEAQAEQGLWPQAAESFKRSLERTKPTDYEAADAWYRLALLALVQGDQAGYRGLCRQLFRQRKDAPQSQWWETYALGPGALDRDELLAVRETVTSHTATAKQALLYRAGDDEAAIRRLTRGLVPTPLGSLFQALAHTRSGKDAAARSALETALRLLERPWERGLRSSDDRPVYSPDLPWHERAWLGLLVRESESLLRQAKREDPKRAALKRRFQDILGERVPRE